ncbi:MULTISPECIES: hypothetical protein [Paenibacillus]|uniref:hypothetical protein n=1 Tax=Paenibacillus TaxID=44249 RepID=UPI000CFBF09B|nr:MULTISPECIES: hypothetical protein [Paenibacillus]MCP1181825.1 hypothetical protein [Paenibacillus sp. 1781tsa1]PRA01745.1 hypothetical protein CQ043_25260 [Paenibacillus sp. MYb63]PRA44439.1 hypothetical protein CQ061_25600 [Paenibacillus sp. MYb67]QZN77507.1 hypothetical protein K5K90_10165 [Paenibacillus sp. DR312]TDL63218.1 hypothetical protein E2R58_24475 [Paenibacillus amylolyticus]
MKNLKKLFLVVMTMVVLLVGPSSIYASELVNNTADQSESNIVSIRIPLTFIPSEQAQANDGSITTMAVKPLDGYADVVAEVENGNHVFVDWSVYITTPQAKITRVDLELAYSDLVRTPFKYSTFQTKNFEQNQDDRIFTKPGQHAVTLTGSVTTTKGVLKVITTGNAYFTTK